MQGRRGWARQRIAIGVATLLAAALLGACTGGSGDDADDDRPAPTTTATTQPPKPATAADVLDRIGCDTAKRYRGTWYFNGPLYPDVRDCSADGEFVARIALFESPEDRAEGVTGYQEATDRILGKAGCSGTDPERFAWTWVIAGDDWMAITVDDERAHRISDATGAPVTDFSPTASVPYSFVLPLELCEGN